MRRRALGAALAALALPRPARAAGACDVALVLAMDVSGSVSPESYALQRDGTAAALRSPAVAAATRHGLAVAVLMWGTHQHAVLGWRVLRSPADAAAAAADLSGVLRPEGGGTNVAGALRGALDLLRALPCAADRLVVDLSGDGRHQGSPDDMAAAVAEAGELGAEVNALPIVTSTEPDVAEWYREHVTGPAGGFSVPADWAGFDRAIRRKLAIEVA